MPITRRQFELGIDSDVEALMGRIAAFLEGRWEEAFTPAEIWAECCGPEPLKGSAVYPVGADEVRFFYTLQRLVDLGVVGERELGHDQYFAAAHVPLGVALSS